METDSSARVAGASAVRARCGALGILAHRLHGRGTGVGRYIRNLLHEWSAQWAAPQFPFDRIVLVSREPLEDYRDAPGVTNVYRQSVLPDAAWEQVHAPTLARGLALLFCPSYSAPLLASCPTVVATLDMLQETRPGDFPLSARLARRPLYRWSARRARHVITLADATVPEIVRRYGIPIERVHAIPLAPGPEFTDAPGAQDGRVVGRYGLAETPFVLFVGKMSARRHIPELIAGFRRAVDSARLPHRLVLVGPDARRQVSESAEGQVRYLGHVPDDDLPELYRRADLVAYLSEEEGFGLPIVEAMRSGTAVLTLNRPVSREVAGTAAHYLEHASVTTIADALTTLLQNHDLRLTLARDGLRRADDFSWARTASRTLDVLVRAAASHQAS